MCSALHLHAVRYIYVQRVTFMCSVSHLCAACHIYVQRVTFMCSVSRLCAACYIFSLLSNNICLMIFMSVQQNQLAALFAKKFVTCYMFWAYYVGWLLAVSWHNTQKCTNCYIYSACWWWANSCSKHVAAVNRNKLKANGAHCWSHYADMLRCTVSRTLNLCQN
jgi:hypothetical protein